MAGASGVSAPELISVPERGQRPLAPGEWRLLSESDAFWRLVDQGYFGVGRLSPGNYELQGKKYVGHATFDGIELRCSEKVDGTVISLVGAATGSDIHILIEDSPASEFDDVSRHLMVAFVEAASTYIATRRKARFRYRAATGPMLAGSLDMSRTILLHASGRLGIFAFDRCEAVRDEPLDRLVLAGLDELHRSGNALGLDPDLLFQARWQAGALDEVRDEEYVRTPRPHFLAIADEMERSSELDEDVDLARLAAIVLLHRGFGLDPRIDLAPRTWFIDLETLFEKAVRRTLGELLDPIAVDKGEPFQRRLFPTGADTARTNPDLVVHDHGQVLSVGDVKYKSIAAEGKKEGRPDIYQVLVHAASLDANHAFLIYPSDQGTTSRKLGRSATGCETWIVQVRPHHLVEDLILALDELMIPAVDSGSGGEQVCAPAMHALAK
jgi:hypothetical protein